VAHHSVIPISGYTSVLSQSLTLRVYKEIKKQYDMRRSENQNRLDNLVYSTRKNKEVDKSIRKKNMSKMYIKKIVYIYIYIYIYIYMIEISTQFILVK
jgi:hypothetical protein